MSERGCFDIWSERIGKSICRLHLREQTVPHGDRVLCDCYQINISKGDEI